MSLLSEYLQKHPSIEVEPNWLIKSVTEQAITEMAAAIEEEMREKDTDEVDLVLYCYIKGECKFVDGKRVIVPQKERKA